MPLQKPPTELGKLEFLDIKRSLIQYLESQPIFAGYEFEGSALSSLLDILTYNTYYYAFYSNMTISEAFLDSAQRIESLISLTKPLGYTVPSKTSAKTEVIVTGVIDNIIPRNTVFYGVDSEGSQFTFYNLVDIPVVPGEPTQPFFIYEGKSLIDTDVINQFDYERQRVVIVDDEFDLETIEVRVLNPETQEYETWNRLDNIGYSNTIDQKIYFIERIETGFIISFGILNSVGANIQSNVTSIRVRYLRSSGTSGNDIVLFTSAVGTVVTDADAATYGGKDDPSLDTIKFLAPKWFAAQERAVTVNDYKALIVEAGFFKTENEFSIYGGEEIYPRRYGRVFITSQRQLNQVTDLMEFIRQKSIITILPEYVTSNLLNVYLNFKFTFNDGLSRTTAQKLQYLNNIKAIFAQSYAKTREYNLYFSSSEFIAYIQSIYPEISMTVDDFNLFVEQTVDARISDYAFNLQNEINAATNQKLIISDTFTTREEISFEPLVYVIDNTIGGDFEKPLKIYNSSLTSEISSTYGPYGFVSISEGNILIKGGYMNTATKFTIPFKEKTIRIGLNNLVTFAIKNITVV